MSWSGPLGPKATDRPTRSMCVKLPPAEDVDGRSARFGNVLVVDGGADVPQLTTGDVAKLREHAAAVLAAVDWIERGQRSG